MITLDKLAELHMSYLNSGNRKPQYLLYGQDHYNSVVYEEDTALIAAVAEPHHLECTAGTVAPGDLDPAPSLDTFLSNHQHDSERNNRGNKRKAESAVSAVAEPHHLERTAGTAASGDLGPAPRLDASLLNQQHVSKLLLHFKKIAYCITVTDDESKLVCAQIWQSWYASLSIETHHHEGCG